MEKYEIEFKIVHEVPDDEEKAKRLSIELTMDFGDQGWEPVTAYSFGNNKLAVVLKRPVE